MFYKRQECWFHDGEPKIFGNIETYKNAKGEVLAVDYQKVIKAGNIELTCGLGSRQALIKYCKQHLIELRRNENDR